MPARRRRLKIVSLVVGTGVAICAVAIPLSANLLAAKEVSLPPVAVPVAVSNQRVFEQPVRLKIAKIGIDAPIDQMGLTPDGALDAPRGPKSVGWYKLGPRPGNKGAAVIDGHYGTWKNGATSVFDRLNELLPGDRIDVPDAAGVTASFVVRGSKKYARNKTAPEIFNAADGGAHLNLITCQGSWDEARQTYAERLVVFADLVPFVSAR